MKTFTLAQLRAAFILWEGDVRANRDAFQSEEESRSQPIEEAADGYVEVMGQYLDKAGG
ncbi:TPA: hypothetical protein ACU967_002253 [Burkholderia contaminans]|uniref:hypothetical protein n=1 Tax=Burkholderia contaminans TaxID=488447 RepID=UPI00158E2459|nr:hypothetical protein [Burkholderia contaminans]MBM6427935.1 hypothetical protein [Burkholderia contaminans]MCA7876766.1 hypothetical protein [Burkholderia contaminans]MDN8024211.1 hypothetical protein [Burkholderia contaminans]HDR9065496.1 hypothetical protein [Burkholderia vietnamiensis]